MYWTLKWNACILLYKINSIAIDLYLWAKILANVSAFMLLTVDFQLFQIPHKAVKSWLEGTITLLDNCPASSWSKSFKNRLVVVWSNWALYQILQTYLRSIGSSGLKQRALTMWAINTFLAVIIRLLLFKWRLSDLNAPQW